MLGIGCRASCVLCKYTASELHPQPCIGPRLHAHLLFWILENFGPLVLILSLVVVNLYVTIAFVLEGSPVLGVVLREGTCDFWLHQELQVICFQRELSVRDPIGNHQEYGKR